MRFLIKSLVDVGVLMQYGYNWRSDTYMYRITDKLLIPTMISLVRDTPEQTIEVLKAVGGTLRPSYIQRLLWKYISSNYEDVNVKEIDDYQISQCYDILVDVVTNPDFAALITLFNPTNFEGLMDCAMKNIFDNQLMVDTAYLRYLIGKYGGHGHNAVTHGLMSLYYTLDLYDYLSRGQLPSMLYPEVTQHRVIAAIHEGRRGNADKAHEHFRKAVMRNYNLSRHFPYIIINFFYILICYRSGTEEGRKRSLIVSKSLERVVTMSMR